MTLDSIVSSQSYDIIKTIYDTNIDATPNPISSEGPDSAPRIKVLQSALGQLRLNNIATLDAITTHFTRLIDLTSADEDYVATLAQTLAPCILRPRTINALTMEERHPYRLIRDLFEHKEAIFGELKRQASTGGTGGITPTSSLRNRAVSSTDESSRRAAMEARARAINDATHRAKSPAPTSRHRRDKSTDGSLGSVGTPGRFPVVVPSHGGRVVSQVKRTSLEVPGNTGSSPVSNRHPDPTTGNSTSGQNTTPSQHLENLTNQSTEIQSPESVNPTYFQIAPAPTTSDSRDNSNSNSRPSSIYAESAFPLPTAAIIEAIQDGAMPGAFGAPSPMSAPTSTSGSTSTHMPPPLDDDDSAANSPTASTPTTADGQPRSASGSLKRAQLGSGSGGAVARRGPSGRYGSLKTRSNLNLGGAGNGPGAGVGGGTQGVDHGVTLRDRAMDEDFS